MKIESTFLNLFVANNFFVVFACGIFDLPLNMYMKQQAFMKNSVSGEICCLPPSSGSKNKPRKKPL
jgi:hypothetical protein